MLKGQTNDPPSRGWVDQAEQVRVDLEVQVGPEALELQAQTADHHHTQTLHKMAITGKKWIFKKVVCRSHIASKTSTID